MSILGEKRKKLQKMKSDLKINFSEFSKSCRFKKIVSQDGTYKTEWYKCTHESHPHFIDDNSITCCSVNYCPEI